MNVLLPSDFMYIIIVVESNKLLMSIKEDKSY